MAEREYHRLTRARRRRTVALASISSYSLWLGRDHLLLIESNGYSENYKRFYFRDIQAIVVRRTNSRTIISIVLAALAALFLLIGVLIGETSAVITFAVIAIVTGLIPLAINLGLGPTCLCQLRTAVQTEDLPIYRVGMARKILRRIQPLIAEAQGQISPEEVQAQMQALANPPPMMTSAPANSTYPVDDPNTPPRMTS